MPYTLDLFELNFARVFTPPKFEVVANVGRILQSLYDTLSPEFTLKLADLSALPGSSMADVGARLKMFDGHFTIEVTSERLNIHARGLRNAADLSVATKTAVLSQQTVSALFPDIKVGETTITMFGWMKKDAEGDPTAKEILSKVMPTAQFEVKEGESTAHPIRMRLRNQVEQYSCEFVCDEAVVPNTELFFSFTLKVEPTSPHQEILQLSQLGDTLLRRWFAFMSIPLISISQTPTGT